MHVVDTGYFFKYSLIQQRDSTSESSQSHSLNRFCPSLTDDEMNSDWPKPDQGSSGWCETALSRNKPA